MRTIYWVVGVIIVVLIIGFIWKGFSMPGQQPPPASTDTQSPVTVVPIEHASLVLKWGTTTIYADPVGDASLYAAQPRPDIILVTHIHGDHFSTSTLEALVGSSTVLVVPQNVADELPANLKTNLVVMQNSDTHTLGSLAIQAVPAYNIRPDAQQYHPKGRDNGYLLEANGYRVYIAGDTEGTPEMKALTDIDVAFVPMNLPYTMTPEDAAAAVLAFKPKQVYPYHYRQQDGLADTTRFKQLVDAGNAGINVVLADWYPKQ